MSVGFTGTRKGMTEEQKVLVREILDTYTDKWIHLGDCKGADEQAYWIATELDYNTFGHPPIIEKYRVFLDYDEQNYPKEYHVRNRAIVNLSDFLIACPYTEVEQLGTGTWSTWRYAKIQYKPTYLILPSGTVIKEENKK